ncbi:actin-like ATPase domain-containing protein [Athelia psychrophila]|uniref:Actin-like ATPase domain-containing protein n=1 Tax=Athelia psychrophila TaxID=1759441 RepID=A0A166Q0I5_9AGAM|nr:actin-like ATPase domain-containing protein [Fibularhizoctonia sp. CBS 109695]
MTIAFRDSTVVVIETGRTLIRAGIGLAELLKTPSLEIPARVGLRKSAFNDTHDHSNNPLSNEKPTGARPSASNLHASDLPYHSSPSAKVNDYLVGAQLEEALAAGQEIIVSWPFADGDVRDWVQAEAIWKHILFRHLQLRRAQNESPVMLCMAAGISRDSYSRISQIFFERFNVAGFSILPRPMAQLYATNTLNGVVVDIGYDRTDVTPIYEGFMVERARAATSLGIKDCQAYLAQLLRSNQSVMTVISEEDPETAQKTLLDLAKKIWEDGLVKVPSDGQTIESADDDGVTDIAAIVVAGREKQVIEAGTKKKATAKASAAEQARAKEVEALDLVTVEFRDQTLTLGKERHRFCEPLFDPTLLKGLKDVQDDELRSVQDVVGHAVNLVEVDLRQYVWAGLFVTGELTNYVKGIGTALQSRLSPYILSNPDQQNDVQTRHIRVLAVPDYFAEFREKGENLAAFLGSSIVAKAAFNDAHGKNFVSKADYVELGPRAIIEMSAALL